MNTLCFPGADFTEEYTFSKFSLSIAASMSMRRKKGVKSYGRERKYIETGSWQGGKRNESGGWGVFSNEK